jgi:hypothetical protein
MAGAHKQEVHVILSKQPVNGDAFSDASIHHSIGETLAVL